MPQEPRPARPARSQALHLRLTLTDLYNVVEKLGAVQPLTSKEQITQDHGLAAVVLSLHQQLDAAVGAAYGRPADLPGADLLTRLVQLNQQRIAEEAAGTVRYLRAEYQSPGQQAALALPIAKTIVAPVATAAAQLWPVELAQDMFAVRNVVQQAGSEDLISAKVAARFQHTKADKVKPLLDALAMMALVRHIDLEDTYAA